MKPMNQFCALAAALFAAATIATGETTVTTDPVGYVSLSLPSASDTIVSVPLSRPAEYTGGVASVSGSTITVSGTTDWTAGKFVYAKGVQSNHYYVLIGPNPVALAGTVSTTEGSKVISGVGTTFSTSVHVDDVLIVNNYGCYVVTAVNSNTSLTVNMAAKATTTGANASVSVAASNPNEGCIYEVKANDTTSLTLDLKGDNINSVSAGTQISVIPYWTLGTLFPASSAGTAFTETPAATFRTHQTEIVVPNYSKAGVNITPKPSYFFVNNAWRIFARPLAEDYNDDIFIPNTYFIVRNPATAASGTLTVQGNVNSKVLTVPLSVQSGISQDTLVGLARPVDVTLNDLGLIESGAFTPTDSVNFRVLADQLFVFDYTNLRINKQPAKIYFYCRDGWRQFGKPLTTDVGSDVIPAGTGFIIRKQPLSQAQTVFWQNTANFN